MGIKVGTAPVSWGVMEVEGWGGQIAYGKMLDEMAEAGYQGTELGPYGYLPAEPETLLAELSSRNLQMVSAFVPLPLAWPERHEAGFQEVVKVAELLAQSGAKIIVLADEMSKERMSVAGRVTEERDAMSEQQWDAAVRILRRVAVACRERSLAVAFHHHVGTFIETPGEIERLCESTDADLIGLCLDTGHYYYGGGDPLEAVERYGSRIRHLHLKDIRADVLATARQEGIGFLEAVRRGIFCELGNGAVDFPKVNADLLASGYDGWAIVEQDIDAGQTDVRPVESAIRSRQYLRKVIGI